MPRSLHRRAHGSAVKTAAQQYKNIQVLKDIPADQLIPTMQFIAGSLGVECDFCHVKRQFDKDDKPEKKTARRMMEMMFAINKDNFKGEREVTCNTCHRGSPHPAGHSRHSRHGGPQPEAMEAMHEHDEQEKRRGDGVGPARDGQVHPGIRRQSRAR